MAAVASDIISDHSRFHPTMFARDGQDRSQTETSYLQPSHSRAAPPSSPRPHPTQIAAGTPPSSTPGHTSSKSAGNTGSFSNEKPGRSASHGASDGHSRQPFASQQNFTPRSSDPLTNSDEQLRNSSNTGSRPVPLSSPGSSQHVPISRATRSLDDVTKYAGKVIKVRDLAHIQSFASEELLSRDENLKYEISSMPITDIIEMVAGLLTKITTTNDRQHENLHRQIPHTADSPGMTPTTSSVLAFHGKNVPSITILSYLSRIHKYCPTTYEVFLSLLVYFDRMTERVNAVPMQEIQRGSKMDDDVEMVDSTMMARTVSSDMTGDRDLHPDYAMTSESDFNLSHFFVVDSFNIHRLVIAGVTCASKFFSDVFYTNSRYAKVSHFILFPFSRD
jgi:hypothetical protein